MKYPDEFTLDEAEQALRHSEAFKLLLGVTKVPDKLRIRFCWRRIDELQRCPGSMTMLEYRQPPQGWEVALIIDEGGGGMRAEAPIPELAL
jgi:hypothetical protein